ncbi:MAG: MFS transporter, partial [Actinomycetes bacterium]
VRTRWTPQRAECQSGVNLMAPGRTDSRLFTRRFVMLGIAELGYFTAMGVSIYALPLFATGPVGAGSAGAGLAFGVFALTALVLRPIAGRLCDTIGRFPLLIVGAAVAAVGLAVTADVDTLVGLVVIRLILGVGEAAFVVAAFAALADVAPPERMGEAVSYNSLGLYVGIAIGPVIGHTIATHQDLRAAWYGAAALAVLATLCTFGVGETLSRSSAVSSSPARRFIHWPAIPIGFGFLTGVVAMGGFLAFASLRAQELDLANTSLPLLAYGMTVVLCRVVFAKLPDRVPALPLGTASLALTAVGLLIAASWQAPAGLVIGAVVLAVGVAFTTPAFLAAMFATAAPEQRGAASATVSVMIDVGLGAGPLILGVVAQAFGLGWAFATAAVIASIGSMWVAQLARARRVAAS